MPRQRTNRKRTAKKSKRSNPKRSNPKRSNKSSSRKIIKKYRGGSGVSFPATITSDSLQNPQSYLPHNDFSNDPNNYLTSSRLIQQPFSLLSGGRKKQNKSKKIKGGNVMSYNMAHGLSSNFGSIPSAGLLTDVGGVTGAASNLTGLSSVYNGSPNIPVPIA